MYTCTIGTADTNTREYEICSKEESKQHDVGCDPREVRSKIKGSVICMLKLGGGQTHRSRAKASRSVPSDESLLTQRSVLFKVY